MGSPSDSIRNAAMGKACAYVRRNPDFFEWLDTDDPSGKELLAEFMAEPAVRWYLNLGVSYVRHDEVARKLIDKADDFVHRGVQAELSKKTYVEQVESGKLQGLSPTRLAVHRAAFSLCIHFGSPTIGSLRLVAILVEAQSGIARDQKTIDKHLRALTLDGLIHFEPGRRGMRKVPNGLPRVDAGKISLDLPTDPSRDLVPEVVLGLALTSSQISAVIEYIAKAKKRNEANLARYRERKEGEFAAIRERKEAELAAIRESEAIFDRILIQAEWEACRDDLLADAVTQAQKVHVRRSGPVPATVGSRVGGVGLSDS